MQAPIDYPVSEDTTSQSVNRPVIHTMTYAALFERHDSAQQITEDMIQSATLNMEAAQHFPFVSRPETIDTDFAQRARSEAILTRLLKVIR